MSRRIGAQAALLYFVVQPVRILHAIRSLIAIRDHRYDLYRMTQLDFQFPALRAVILGNVDLLADLETLLKHTALGERSRIVWLGSATRVHGSKTRATHSLTATLFLL